MYIGFWGISPITLSNIVNTPELQLFYNIAFNVIQIVHKILLVYDVLCNEYY